MSDTLAALAAVALVAAGHVIAKHLRFLEVAPRSWVLSAGGGVSVAYVFVHLLPEIAQAQQAVDEAATGFLAAFERHAYVAALVGLVLFYGVERAAVVSGGRHREGVTGPVAFGAAVACFATYNVLIGYLLVEKSELGDRPTLVLFAVALFIHMVLNDLGLREHHHDRYDQWGRWILVAAPFAGFLIGQVLHASEAALGVAVAFLGGGIVLNVLKEELPKERDSRFGAFAGGAAVFTTLLLAV